MRRLASAPPFVLATSVFARAIPARASSALVLPVLVFSALPLSACGQPAEPPRVELPVVVDSSGIETITNDLGYDVTLSDARVMIENIVFTIAGEAHSASLWQRASDFLVPSVWAHPGHFQGGDVTGELRGRFELNWLGDDTGELGSATLLVGNYQSANFTFIRGTEEDGLASDDPLLGHTALLRGAAALDGIETSSIEFTVILDSPSDRELVGAPFDFTVRETTTEELGLRLLTLDPLEDDTLFDGIDFAALDQDGDGEVTIEPSATDSSLVNAYNLIRRNFQTHDHFDVVARPPIE